ncbi:DUF4442 domain-containing protein [Maribacter sp.]|nr:DUF4442 domain-containing protein [Maribacter sp.]
MTFYQTIAKVGSKFMGKNSLFKYAFNLSPMYKRSTAKIIYVSKDLLQVHIKLPISYKNRNYVNSIYGGSMFSAVDPIPMVQLINLIGDDYVVWDKSAEIFFKRPAKENLYAEFDYTLDQIADIRKKVAAQNEVEIVKTTFLTDKNKSKTYCEVRKTLYIADKKFYKEKRKLARTTSNPS